MDHNQKRDIKKIAFLGAALLLLIFLIIFLPTLRPNPFGNEINIANLDTYTKDQPSNQDRLNYIKNALYQTISLNLDSSLPNNSIKDVLIRENTFSQTYNADLEQHAVSFIVDIASLQQSYAISYQWAKNPDNIQEYSTIIKCLSGDQVIYPTFQCQDQFSQEIGTTDPIARLLPHIAHDYRIDPADLSAEKPKIRITLLIHLYETPYTEASQKAESLKPQALNWLRNQGITPESYEIQFTTEIN